MEEEEESKIREQQEDVEQVVVDLLVGDNRGCGGLDATRVEQTWRMDANSFRVVMHEEHRVLHV